MTINKLMKQKKAPMKKHRLVLFITRRVTFQYWRQSNVNTTNRLDLFGFCISWTVWPASLVSAEHTSVRITVNCDRAVLRITVTQQPSLLR